MSNPVLMCGLRSWSRAEQKADSNQEDSRVELDTLKIEQIDTSDQD
jgi:hypothetical protein